MNIADTNALVVASTDFLLALEAFYFCWRIRTDFATKDKGLVVALFGFLALAALWGAFFHAFFPLKETTQWGWRIWILTASTTGLVAAVLYVISVVCLWGQKSLIPACIVVAALFAAFFLWLTNIEYHFKTVVYFYAPALVLFAGVAFRRTFRQETGWDIVSASVVLSACAALLQSSSISIVGLDHNSLYHIFQALGLLFLYIGFRKILFISSHSQSWISK